ncbi:MAG: hypothetical protein J7K78_05075 [Thaumarchaeota archaeon]|nr:hypothetical protein [Nitrososphaerota archaeon]
MLALLGPNGAEKALAGLIVLGAMAFFMILLGVYLCGARIALDIVKAAISTAAIYILGILAYRRVLRRYAEA